MARFGLVLSDVPSPSRSIRIEVSLLKDLRTAVFVLDELVKSQARLITTLQHLQIVASFFRLDFQSSAISLDIKNHVP